MSQTWADLAPAWWQVGPSWAGIFEPAPPWRPLPSIRINDVEFVGDTVGTVTIRRGRDSVYVEPSASYASVNLRAIGQPPQLKIGDRLTIDLNTTLGVPVTLFSGRISDVEAEVVQAQTTIGEFRLTAVGPLAGANRRQVLTDGRPVEKDGQRALAALLSAFAQTWEDTPPTVQWQDAEGTWADDVDPIAIDKFDEGVFEVTALDAQDGGYSALELAQEASFSGGGVLYETRDGRIAYADAERRAVTLGEDDFRQIPAAVLSLDGMRASSSLSELANRVFVEWRDGVATADVVESQLEYGLLVRRLTTILQNEPDAQRFANEKVDNFALPVFKADQFRLLLNNLDSPLLDDLIRVEPNDGVDFTDLPDVLGFNRLQAFVEGVDWRIEQYRAELGLFASDARLSVGGVWWGRVDSTLEWGDVDPALQWQDVGRTL